MPAPTYKLSPSDLTFLWDECPRCFYLKVVNKFGRPFTPFPSIFGKIDLLMKNFYADKTTQEIDPSLPPGRVLDGGKGVYSAPITLPGHTASVYIRGLYDTVLAFDDGSYGVIDFKTSAPSPHHVAFYGRQLHAYAHALEHPGEGKLHLAPISLLGLLIVTPTAMTGGPTRSVNFEHDLSWLPIPLDREGFTSFLDEVLTVLEQPEPPDPAEKCGWCSYRHKVRANPDY
jgi:hypothetical protein